MRTTLFKGQALQMVFLTCLAVIFGMAGTSLAQHPPVDLLDANGKYPPAKPGDIYFSIFCFNF
ncbi:MAG: hypothetical protein QNK24_00060 [Desulfuromusa sp.]|nr:hypothetical protein [Desulfuromusa sp.]